MKQLSKLTPAETLLIKNGSLSPLKDLLKYTLMDLLLKQVLNMEEIQRQPSPRDPVRYYKYISAGVNFRSYKGKPHEMVFLEPFKKNPDLNILFRNLVKIGYQNSKSEKKYYNDLINNDVLQKAFSTSWSEKLFGGFTYTKEGNELKHEVENEIAGLQKKLRDPTEDKNRTIEILKMIGGNIFLIQGVSFALSTEIDNEILQEINRTNAMEGFSTGCWSSFDSYSDTFESSCSSDAGSSCSADGGGCSGCGGCGGD
ncbi:MAG: hypothetical protein C0490_01625 [Marivirga sp.]|nr:hypothetical protein [Marivirga sp.]